MSDPMEYLNQAKANLAAMQQAVAVQAQQEQMAMLLRERISQIDQMVAEPAEPVGSTTSYLSEEDRQRFGLDPVQSSSAARGRQPAMQPASAMMAPGARPAGFAPPTASYPQNVPGPSANRAPMAAAGSHPGRRATAPPAGMDSGTVALIRKLEECGEYENAEKLRRSFS